MAHSSEHIQRANRCRLDDIEQFASQGVTVRVASAKDIILPNENIATLQEFVEEIISSAIQVIRQILQEIPPQIERLEGQRSRRRMGAINRVIIVPIVP